ncbi:MAG: aminotransferase class I/II-fold pyridoxal phosphate-dependent enzyme [Pseudonocardiaceae bacterium]
MEPGRLFGIMPGYEALENERRSPGARPFISDYHGAHPFVEDYLGSLASSPLANLGDVTRYAAIDEDRQLRAKIAHFHRRYDGVDYSWHHVLPGAGSSMLLGTFCTWLTIAGYSRVYYLPPIYYKFAYLFKQYGIEPVPVSDLHAFQPDFELRLPERKALLVLTDPVWYAGRKVSCEVLDAIRAWQFDTGSMVFIDGTFQYMQWDRTLAEASARLPVDQTLRMVCPTKFLSLHGYRCAWLLVPQRLRDKLFELHLNLHGDVSLSDRLFAHRACDVMLDGGNHNLLHYVQRNYHRLVDKGAIDEHFDVETGYFLFARPRAPRASFLSMGQDLFELNGYPEHVRINLLNNSAIDVL